MTRALPGPRGGKGKQKSLCPTHGTKAAASAIPPKLTLKNVHSLTRTIIRAPMDNGWDARRSLLSVSAVRSALRSPFAGRSPPRSHHRGLSEGLPRRVLLSVTGLRCLIVVAYYTQARGICQPPFQRKFCRAKAEKLKSPVFPAVRRGRVRNSLLLFPQKYGIYFAIPHKR